MTLPRVLHFLAAAFLVAPSTVAYCAGGAQDLPASLPAQIPSKPAELTVLQRGDLYMIRKMYREAVDTYSQALLKTMDPVLYNKIGIAYHQMQDYKAAKKNYEQALKLNPQYAEARNNIGALYHMQRNFRRAIQEYNRALKLQPNSASFHRNLGTAYFARKNYTEASKAYQRALALDPNVFESGGSAGSILQVQNVEERAVYHYYLAKAYAQAGETDRALQYIRKSLEEGFKERKRFLEEPEFAKLQDLPEFQKLMKAEIRVL